MGLNPWQIAGISGGAVGLTGIIAALVTMRLKLSEPDGESAPPPPVQAIKSDSPRPEETAHDRYRYLKRKQEEEDAKNKRVFDEPVTFEEPEEPPRLANAQKGLVKEEELHRERRKESWESQKALNKKEAEVPYHERRKRGNRRLLEAIPPPPSSAAAEDDDDDFEAVFESLPYELQSRFRMAAMTDDVKKYAELRKEAEALYEMI